MGPAVALAGVTGALRSPSWGNALWGPLAWAGGREAYQADQWSRCGNG